MIQKTKVNVVSGFLGSGKTTLLRHLLSTPKLPEKIALMINEIGEIVIDSKVLKRSGSDVVELPNGCICCTVTGDFIQGLLDIKKQFSPERIFIEPTGIAEPGRILSALYRPPLEAEFRIEPTITIIDVCGFDKLYKELAYLYVMQIKSADIILLNKMDLTTKKVVGKVEKEIQKLNPRAFLLRTDHCKVDLFNLIEGKSAQGRTSSDKHTNVHPKFESFSFENTQIFSKEKLEKLLNKLPTNVFRLKGFVRLSNGTVLLNYITGQIEWEPMELTNGKTTLTCIGRNLRPKKLKSDLRKCVLSKR